MIDTEILEDGKVKIKHINMVSELAKNPEDVMKTLTLRKIQLLHGVLGLAGEVGELVDAVKKHVFYDTKLDEDNIEEEMGDIEFFMEVIRHELGIARINVLRANIAKLRKRYPEGYSNESAFQRKDKI